MPQTPAGIFFEASGTGAAGVLKALEMTASFTQ